MPVHEKPKKRKKKRKNTTRKVIGKLFALHENAKNYYEKRHQQRIPKPIRTNSVGFNDDAKLLCQ